MSINRNRTPEEQKNNDTVLLEDCEVLIQTMAHVISDIDEMPKEDRTTVNILTKFDGYFSFYVQEYARVYGDCRSNLIQKFQLTLGDMVRKKRDQSGQFQED